MKLSFQQRDWVQKYTAAQKAGGTYSPEEGWIELADISVPEWYEDYLEELESESQTPDIVTMKSVSMNPAMEKFLADSPTVERNAVNNDDIGSNPILPTTMRDIGRIGGQKRASSLSRERRSEIARQGAMKRWYGKDSK